MIARTPALLGNSGPGWKYIVDDDKIIVVADSNEDSLLSAISDLGHHTDLTHWLGSYVGINDLGQEIWIYDYYPSEDHKLVS